MRKTGSRARSLRRIGLALVLPTVLPVTHRPVLQSDPHSLRIHASSMNPSSASCSALGVASSSASSSVRSAATRSAAAAATAGPEVLRLAMSRAGHSAALLNRLHSAGDLAAKWRFIAARIKEDEDRGQPLVDLSQRAQVRAPLGPLRVQYCRPRETSCKGLEREPSKHEQASALTPCLSAPPPLCCSLHSTGRRHAAHALHRICGCCGRGPRLE